MSSSPISRARSWHRGAQLQRGFSLIELMVGLTIGMVLVAGLAVLFANTSRSGNELEKSIRQIENGRYAIELLHDELTLAGFYGEVPGDLSNYSSPDVCATALADLGWDKTTPSTPRLPQPVRGLSTTEAAALPTTCIPNYKPGTVAFAVHRLGTEAVAPATVSTTDVPYAQTSRCNSDPVADPFILSGVASNLNLKTFSCGSTSFNTVRPYLSRVYYIASCNECGSGGDATPTLKMAELRGTAMITVPLAEGIESMVLEYGFDTTDPASATASAADKGRPDVFRTGLSGTAGARDNDWSNVVAVRLHLLSRTVEPSSGYNDSGKTYTLGPTSVSGDTTGFKRRVYTTTARLINVAGPREVPSTP